MAMMNSEVQSEATQQLALRGGDAYPTVPLSTLTEFATQKAYTELQRLVELLPMRTDLEKKVELLGFLYRSRMLFIRLLALVRWETSVNKVEKCRRILQLLETQSGLLIQTADTLASLSRETLQRARLPVFYLPVAIDVLTLHTYPRLPTVIRERLTRPAPLTLRERRELATALNGLIQRRLLREPLPLAMRTFQVRDGRVILTVAREFSVEATLFEHAVRDPQAQEDTAVAGCVWRLLKLRILVVDCDSQPNKLTRGHELKVKAKGKQRPAWSSPLVHPMQVSYLLETAQRYIADKRQPMVALFECLHSFCVALQLEVLLAQTTRLTQTAGSAFTVQPSRDSLRIAFWRERVAVLVSIRHCQVASNAGSSGGENAVHSFSSLVVTHEPALSDPIANARIQNALANDDALSIERVLVLTMHTRVVERLKLFQREFRRLVNGACELKVADSDGDVKCLRPVSLSVPIVARCSSNEQLRIAIDINTNEVRLLCMALRSNSRATQLLSDLERTLNTIDANCNKSQSASNVSETMKQVATVLAELRLLIALARCEASLTFVSGAQPRFVSESELGLRFGSSVGDSVRSLLDKRIACRSAVRALVAVPHHDAAFLVVTPYEVAARKSVAFDFYLLHVSAAPTLLKVQLAAFGSALAADRQLVSRSASESIDEAHFEEQLAKATASVLLPRPSGPRSQPLSGFSFVQTQLARRLDRKRKMLLCFNESSAAVKRSRTCDVSDAEEENESRIVPELTSLLEFTSERLSFRLLSRELQQRGLCVDRVAFDSESGKCSVNVLTFPLTDAGGELDCRVAECTIRRAGASSSWIFTLRIDMQEVLAPLASFTGNSQTLSSVLAVNELYEFVPTESGVRNTVQRIVSDWHNIARMFALIRRFANECQSDPTRSAFLRSFLVLEKCTLQSVVFSYNLPNVSLRRANANQAGELLCTIQCVTEPKSRGSYMLHFSRRRSPNSSLGEARTANPHCLASGVLESLFNSTLSLTELCVAMRSNVQVLKTLSMLDYRLSAGFISRQNVMLTNFSLVAVSPVDLVLVCRNTFSIEISLSAARPNCVMLRERNRGTHEAAQTPFDCLYLFKHFVAKLAEAYRGDSDDSATSVAPIPGFSRYSVSSQSVSSVPVVISVDAFARLFMPVRFGTSLDSTVPTSFTYPLFDAYCGCALLFRQFQRALTNTGDESSGVWRQCEVRTLQNDCAMQLDFAGEQISGSLVLRLSDDNIPTLSLSLRLAAQSNRGGQGVADQLRPAMTAEHTQTLERYFELRVVPQFRPQAVISFVRLLCMPARFMRDAAQLLRFELSPQALLNPGAPRSGPVHYLITWCQCVPPGLQSVPAPGTSALARLSTQQKPRIISFWQLRRVLHPNQISGVSAAELEQHYETISGYYVDRNALTVPLIYDVGSGTLSVSPNSLQPSSGNSTSATLQRVHAHLMRFMQTFSTQSQFDFPLYAALVDLAMHFPI